MNIPNALSVLRLALIPVFIVVLFSGMDHAIPAAVAIYVFSGFTDVLDGYIARKYNMTTKLGKILDPLADKVMQFTAVVCLFIMEIIPLLIVVLFFLKDFLMLLGGIKIFKVKREFPHSRWYGKVATVSFYVACVVLLLCEDLANTFKITIISLPLLIALYALTMYFIQFMTSAGKEKAAARKEEQKELI